MMRLIFVIILFFGVNVVKAQYTTYPMVNVGYSYQNQSFGEVGVKVLFLKKDEVAFRVGGSALMGAVNRQFAVLPKIQGDILFNFRENVDVHQGYYYMLGVESSTRHFLPYVGISALGLLDFRVGYGISYAPFHGKELKGFNFGVGLNIPLVVFQR